MIKPPTKITENIQKPFVLINELLKGENGWWMDEINDVVMQEMNFNTGTRCPNHSSFQQNKTITFPSVVERNCPSISNQLIISH